MKLLAIEKEATTINWSEESEILINEARRVYSLFQEGIIREIYFNDTENAVIVLECPSREDAESILSTLPLAEAGMISFQLMELKPYHGFSRLFFN